MPSLSASDADRFWQGLVNGTTDSGASPEEVEARRTEAERKVSTARTEEDIQQLVEEAGDDTSLRKAIAAAGAVRVSSADFANTLESRYAKYGPLLDRNPRAIKRLVNKLALNQSIMLLEEREIEKGPLARWTILELRWPRVAEALRVAPRMLEVESERSEELAAIWEDRAFINVIGNEPGDRLDMEALRAILGVSAKDSV